jgi:hypothetical protein
MTDCCLTPIQQNCIGGVMVSMLASSAVERTLSSSHWKLTCNLFSSWYHWKIALLMSEWVSVVLRQLSKLSAISWREQVNFQWDDDKVRSTALEASMLTITPPMQFCCIGVKQQSVIPEKYIYIIYQCTCCSTQDILFWFLCSCSLMLCTKCISTKYQFYQRWKWLLTTLFML